MAKKKKISEIKKKKKRWVPILAPREFKSSEIGETYTDEPEKCIGRAVKVNLMTLLRDPKKQNITLTFQISQIKENKALTELISYEMVPAHLKRMTKRAKSNADESFICSTKDNQKFRIKTFAISKIKAPKSTLTDLRKETKELINKFAKKYDTDSFLNEIIRSNLQYDMKEKMKKILPITAFIIKVVKKLETKKTV